MKILSGAKLPITRDGLYKSISIDDYHSDRCLPSGEYGVSSSDLRRGWSLSMAHLFDTWVHNPKRAPRDKEPRHFILGRAAHHLLLGESRFSTEFIKQPDEYRDLATAKMKPWNNNANFCKDWNEKQAKAGRTVLREEELEQIIGMSRSLELEPLVKDGILDGAVECSGFVKDKETGLWIKVRPDVIPTTGGDLVDLKTIDDITDRGIKRRIRESGYHMQAGLCWEVFDQLGLSFETFTLCFTEKDRPFCVRMIPIEDEDLARGRQQCRLMMRKVADCIDRGMWPGLGQGELRSLSLPADERDFIDARLKSEGML